MKNELAVLGFVLGILALVFFWVPFVGFLMAVAGILISAVALNRSKTLGDGEKRARTGMTLSIIALAVGAVVALLATLGVVLGAIFSELSDNWDFWSELDKY